MNIEVDEKFAHLFGDTGRKISYYGLIAKFEPSGYTYEYKKDECMIVLTTESSYFVIGGHLIDRPVEVAKTRSLSNIVADTFNIGNCYLSFPRIEARLYTDLPKEKAKELLLEAIARKIGNPDRWIDSFDMNEAAKTLENV